MFTSFYEPLPDLKKALSRIGCADIPITQTEETLDKLIHGFLTNVPYENLTTSIEHKIPSLASKDLYEKFVIKRRGGYCFEMNGFFWLLLRDLGFDTYSVSAYVLEYKDFLGALGHRANVAMAGDKKYITDVGFGGRNVADFAVPMDGTLKRGFFVIYDEAEREYTLCREVDEEKEREAKRERFVLKREMDGREISYIKVIMFRDYKAYPQEFYLPNIGVSHQGGHYMIDNVIVNMKNELGEVYTVFNDEFKGSNASGKFTRRIENREELKSILREYFNMNI